jgi:hypothetical protein
VSARWDAVTGVIATTRGRPSRAPSARLAARASRVCCEINRRSSFLNTPATPSMAEPIGVVMSNPRSSATSAHPIRWLGSITS